MGKAFQYAFIAVGLASCGGGGDPAVEERLSMVRSSMKDPYSARFEGVFLQDDGDTLCGSVNAKNSMGAYIGSKNFYVKNNHVIIEQDASELVEYEPENTTFYSSHIYSNPSLDRMIESSSRARANIVAEIKAMEISSEIRKNCSIGPQSKRYEVPAEGPAKLIK